ncbi:MAG: hypothetical protein PHP37_03705 [Patescibacteria group bacterium]|jgi:hypothetical protein|nr:hypothetical protein [Patescibacteria group bacterium]
MSVIETTNLKYYLSGGAGNTDPNASIGGVISSTEVADNNLHNLFAKVKWQESEVGSEKYRAIFIKNEHASLTWEDVVAFIKSQSTSDDTSIEIGVCDEGKNQAIEVIDDEDTAPDSVVFKSGVGIVNGVSVGDLEKNDYIGIWVKRVVNQGASAKGDDTAELECKGGTTATV